MLKREFVKFFSMEGIVSRLQFLNPAVVVREVELILMRYEKYYALEMSGHVRLNLYMHIAFMFERLMIAQDGYEEEQREILSKRRSSIGFLGLYCGSRKNTESDWMNMNCRCYTNCLKD